MKLHDLDKTQIIKLTYSFGPSNVNCITKNRSFGVKIITWFTIIVKKKYLKKKNTHHKCLIISFLSLSRNFFSCHLCSLAYFSPDIHLLHKFRSPLIIFTMFSFILNSGFLVYLYCNFFYIFSVYFELYVL